MRSKLGEHAVVLGASMAGLLAARVLSDAYARVTVVERDRLPGVGEGRKAVPQGRHVHLLLPAGLQCLDSLLPGLRDELFAAGAHAFEPHELRIELRGHAMTRRGAPETSVSATRPLIEGLVRRRVLALPNVDVMERTRAVGLATDDRNQRITGVRVQGPTAQENLKADRVLAATGRAGQVPAWLEALGYARPLEESLRVEVRYATRRLQRKPEDFNGDKWVLVGARPGRPRTLVLSAVEGDRWLLTLAGYGSEHHPPTDEEGFMAFAASVAPPDVMAVLRDAEPLDDVVTYDFPANRRRRYDRLKILPKGLLVFGDALASFNPLYGQGMTVAALEAVALRDCLQHGERQLERRFLRAATHHVDHAWQMAIASDLALPEVEGPRPAHVRVLNAYTDRLLRVARHDSVVATAFRSVVGMLRSPPHLMRPGIALRVLRG